jgi:histidine triad (HIT) family protein
MVSVADPGGHCIFCSIVDGSASAHEVFRDDVAVGFLDRAPLFPGHVLMVPVGHVVTLPELPIAAVGPFFERVQAMARVVPEVMEAQGSFVAMNNVVSQSVAHLHVHVVPRNRKDGLKGFFWPRTRYAGDEEMAAVAARLRERVNGR